MKILQLLATKNYIIVNKDLIKLIGLEEAIIFGELASEYEYWLEKNELNEDYFYSTVDNITESTLLTEHKQRRILNNLKDKGLIDIKIKGIPAKRYIKINEEQVLKLLNIQFLKNLGTSSLKIEELALKNFKGNNNKNNNKEEKKKNNKKKNTSLLIPLLSSNNFKFIKNDTNNKVFMKLEEWLKYKQERKEYYKETGLKNLLIQIDKKIDEYGEKAVIELINESMANNWKGIIFDKLLKIKSNNYYKKESVEDTIKRFRKEIEDEHRSN